MTITAYNGEQVLLKKTYYSIGGGFIVDEEHFGQPEENAVQVPYPYQYAADLRRHCKENWAFFICISDAKRISITQ